MLLTGMSSAETSKNIVSLLPLQEPHLLIMFRHIMRSYLDETDLTCILSASKIEEFDVATVLGVDLMHNDNALEYASRFGHLSVVKYLVEKGADMKAINRALMIACYRGHLPVTQYLVEQGADIHGHLLIRASECGHLSIVQYLLHKGANIHAMGGSALHKACQYGRLSVVKYLVEQGADMYSKYTSLAIASEVGHLSVVKYLVEQHHAPITKAGIDHALSCARRRINNPVVQYLKEKGAK